jgi:hypothetical protein
MTANQAESYLDHPMFNQAMGSMQKGDWEAGLDQIEKLMQSYPLEPELRSLRQEMILRSKVDTDEQTDNSQARKKRFRDLTIRFSVIGILAVLAIFVVRTYSNWFQDQVAFAAIEGKAQLLNLELQIKMRDAEDYLNAGQAEQAMIKLEEIKAVNSDYPELDTMMQEAERILALDGQYEEALALTEAGDLAAALIILEEIERQRPTARSR